MAADFTYSISDGFYVIYPENRAAEQTVSAMISTFGANKLTSPEFEAFRKQARAAGYSVRKARATGLSGDDLLSELLN